MTIIADGGSTNCDWVLLDNQGNIVFNTRTAGLNPAILTTQELHKRLAASEEIAHVNKEVENVYFYGAGCGTDKARMRLKRFFEKYFRHAKCEVEEDMLAACLSVTSEPGIVCILGTGSNCCYFDGQQAEVNTPNLGHMIMDEGSGNYFGKQLLRDYFYKKMPTDLAKKFKTKFDLFPDNVKKNLYKLENPNAYLGGFTRYMFSFDPLPDYFVNVLKKGIEDFTENWVDPFPQSKNVPIHFVGTIAHFAQDVIADVLKEKGLILGNVERHPIHGLVTHFQNKIKSDPL